MKEKLNLSDGMISDAFQSASLLNNVCRTVPSNEPSAYGSSSAVKVTNCLTSQLDLLNSTLPGCIETKDCAWLDGNNTVVFIQNVLSGAAVSLTLYTMEVPSASTGLVMSITIAPADNREISKSSKLAKAVAGRVLPILLQYVTTKEIQRFSRNAKTA